MKDIVAMILGGGKGSRLYPLTMIRSKPAVPVGGKYRLIDIPISNCINSDVNKIFVLTQYNSESLNRHITQTYRFGLFSQGFVDILAAEQTPESHHWYQGTADAVRQTLHHVFNYKARLILILSGDHLYRMNYKKLVEFHHEKKAEVSVCVTPVSASQAPGFGILQMDGRGRIKKFVEKPTDRAVIESLRVDPDKWADTGVTRTRSLMASMGIYLFSRDALKSALRDSTQMDFGHDVIPSVLKKKRVFGYIFGDYWEDIGTIAAFYRANLGLTSTRPRFTFYDADAPIYTHPRFLPATRVKDCRIERSIVSEGCVIQEGSISRSVIGIRSVIRKDAKLERTLVMGADFYERESAGKPPLGIGSGAVISDAIIDKNARIGAGVRIRKQRNHEDFDGEGFCIRDGIVIIPKNSVIPDNSVI